MMTNLEDKYQQLNKTKELDDFQNLEKKLVELEFKKARNLNLDKIFLYLYNNLKIIQKVVQIPREKLPNPPNTRWQRMKDCVFYSDRVTKDQYGNYNFLYFNIDASKNTKYINGESKLTKHIFVFQYRTNQIFCYNVLKKKILFINFTNFDVWGNFLLDAYYLVSNALEEYYRKEKAKIDQYEFLS